MLNSPLFQLALAVLLVFLVMAGIVSMIQQAIVEGFRLRARTLRHSITQILSDGVYKDQIAKRFYQHPLTASLTGGRAQPTCIEPDTFVAALATALQPSWLTGDAVDALPASVAALKEGDLKRRLQLILPPPGAPREVICTAVKTWFGTTVQKMGERFKADCVALSWVLAIFVTVTLNVSTIEIVKRLQTDESLRLALASVTPELGRSQATFTALATDPNADPTQQAPAQTTALTANELATLMTIVRCAGGDRDLPVGWPWMARVADSIGLERASATAACAEARQRVEPNSELAQRLTVLEATTPQLAAASAQQLTAGGQAATASPEQRFYGADFQRNGVLEVLLGWMITIIAAAQGAPFWFDMVKRVAGRR